MTDWITDYHQRGYHFPLKVMTTKQASEYRQTLESIETAYKHDQQQYAVLQGHANSVLPFVDEITRLPDIIESVQAILGPDLLVWNASFFTKEPGTTDYVSWHQDLTYWGLSDSHEVTAWLALSEVSVESGCMKFIPGSHTGTIEQHTDSFEADNLLSRGQKLAVDIDESEAINVVLKPGEISLHHGQLFHGSNANQSDDRRIGLAIRYITPQMKQTIDDKTNAKLVAGEDRFNHFWLTPPPNGLLNPQDVQQVLDNAAVQETFLFAGAEQQRSRR